VSLDEEIFAAYRGYLAEERRRRGAVVARLDRGEVLVGPAAGLAAPGDWRNGGCACGCLVTHLDRATGELVTDETQCKCERLVDVSDCGPGPNGEGPDGAWCSGMRSKREPCDPTEHYPRTTINGRPNQGDLLMPRLDATPDLDALVPDARARRDQRMAALGRSTSTRLDATDGASVQAMAESLSMRMGISVTTQDVRDLIAACGGDATRLDRVEGVYRLLQLVRADCEERAQGRAALAAAMPETSPGPEARTDARDLDDVVAKARAARDARALAAGRAG